MYWDYSEHCTFWKKPTGISERDCLRAPDHTAPHITLSMCFTDRRPAYNSDLKNHIICVGTYCLSLHGYAGPSFSTLLLCYLVMDNTAVSATLVNPYFNSYNHPWKEGRRGVEPQIYICCVITGKTALVALASHTEKCKDKYYAFMEEKKGFTN